MNRTVLKIFSSEEEWQEWVNHNAYRITRVQEVRKSGTKWYCHYFMSEADPSQRRRLAVLHANLHALEKTARTIPGDLSQSIAADMIQAWEHDLAQLQKPQNRR